MQRISTILYIRRMDHTTLKPMAVVDAQRVHGMQSSTFFPGLRWLIYMFFYKIFIFYFRIKQNQTTCLFTIMPCVHFETALIDCVGS